MEVTTLRLSELNEKINNTINNAFYSTTFWVIADVTSHSYKAPKNYHSFELVEKDPFSNNIIAKICGKAWGSGAQRIFNFEKTTGQKFTNNINVLLNVSVQYHSVYGLQISVNDIDINFTLGVLEQHRQATLEKLVNENSSFIGRNGDLFITRNNQLKMNCVIQKIAVISSNTSAGFEDFKHTLLNNPFGYQFVMDEYYTAVQGEINTKDFLGKLIDIFNSHIRYDAVVITRGGGAQTDFLIFDNYFIGRAVAKFPIPVITGIGHQKNETITDLMAHTPTKTPTKAAEFIIAHNRGYEETLFSLQKNIVIKSQQLLSFYFQSLSNIRSTVVNTSRDQLATQKDNITSINQSTISLSLSNIFNRKSDLRNIASRIVLQPRILLYNRINDIKNTMSNLSIFKTLYLKGQYRNLNYYHSIINIISQDNILKKGFAIVKVNDKIISDANEVTIGNELDIILSDTIIHSTVTKKSKYYGEDAEL